MDPDWYVDPANASRVRYWDGNAWTDQTAPNPAAAPGPAPVSTWGAASRTRATRYEPPEPVVAARRPFPLRLVLVGLVLVSGGIAALLLRGGGDDAATRKTTEVLPLFDEVGIACTSPKVELTPDAAATAASEIPATFQTASGKMTQGHMGMLMNSVDKMVELAKSLPADGRYAWMRCGQSWVLIGTDSTNAVMLGPDALALRDRFGDLGVVLEVLPTGTPIDGP